MRDEKYNAVLSAAIRNQNAPAHIARANPVARRERLQARGQPINTSIQSVPTRVTIVTTASTDLRKPLLKVAL